jgi:hypothetical protein
VKEEHVEIATKLQIICDAHFDHSHVVVPEYSCLYGIEQEGKRSANERLR